MQPKMRKIISKVSKPFRYVGGEVGSISKDWDSVTLRICLSFPDVYEIGTSHIGLSILYKAINDTDFALADRCYTPWQDMEKVLRDEKFPLFALESGRPLGQFDILGFSLAYELTYTNVLAMLDLSGVPKRASDRDDGDPLIIAGGPCTFNSEPVAPFFDIIVVGDGEEVILEIARIVADGKSEGLSREELLQKFISVPGVYLPNIPPIEGHCPKRAFVADLDKTPFPTSSVVAHSSIQDRLSIEVARGCTRGCRFCQAGYIYRPLRQRSMETASMLALDGLCARVMNNFRFSPFRLEIGHHSILHFHACMKVVEICAWRLDCRVFARSP